MLLHSHPDWTSLSWKLIFKLTLAKLWPHQQPNHMHQLDSITSHSVMQACSHPYQLTEPSLCMYVAYLANQGLKHQTLKCYLAAFPFLAHADRSRPGKPIHSRKLSMAGVCLQRHQVNPVSSGTTPLLADYPSKLVLRGLKSVWAAQAAKPWIYHALGGMLLEIFWFYEGGRVYGHIKPVI